MSAGHSTAPTRTPLHSQLPHLSTFETIKRPFINWIIYLLLVKHVEGHLPVSYRNSNIISCTSWHNRILHNTHRRPQRYASEKEEILIIFWHLFECTKAKPIEFGHEHEISMAAHINGASFMLYVIIWKKTGNLNKKSSSRKWNRCENRNNIVLNFEIANHQMWSVNIYGCFLVGASLPNQVISNEGTVLCLPL